MAGTEKYRRVRSPGSDDYNSRALPGKEHGSKLLPDRYGFKIRLRDPATQYAQVLPVRFALLEHG